MPYHPHFPRALLLFWLSAGGLALSGTAAERGGAARDEGLRQRVAERWAELAGAGPAASAPPRCHAVTAEELGTALLKNRLAFTGCESARRAGAERLEAPEGRARAQRLGERTLAAYEIGEDRILVYEGFDAAARRLLRLYPSATLASEAASVAALLDVVLWHELAHAMQDRQRDLRRLGSSAQGFEARAALSATIEGHAQLCAMQLARSASHRAAFDLLARSHEEAPDACAAQHTRALAACEAGFAYRSGLRFFELLAAHSPSSALLERALLDPPRTLWHVEHPEDWIAGASDPGQAFEAPLRAFAGASFARETWASALENLTRDSLRQAFGALAPERAAALVAAVQGSRVLHVRERAGDERLIFAVMDLGAPERAAALVAAEEEASRSFDAMGRGEPDLALSVRYVRGGDQWVWIEKTCVGDAGAIERSGLLLATAGPLVLELNVLGGTSEARARELVELLVARLH